jgi:hypothetical protein
VIGLQYEDTLAILHGGDRQTDAHKIDFPVPHNLFAFALCPKLEGGPTISSSALRREPANQEYDSPKGDSLLAATGKGLPTMCDFSLQHAKSRPAVVADKLVSHNFGRGTIGFKSVDDPIGDATAVCILPGTELAFDKPIKLRWVSGEGNSIEGRFTTAIFRQKDKDKPNVHHDVLEMPDGQQILLTHLEEGQNATVLQLPAAPKTEKEAEEQKRAEYIG